MIINQVDNTIIVNNFDNTTILEVPGEKIVSESNVTQIIETGVIGPAGPSGDEDVMYGKRTDFISDNELYRGEASPGTAEDVAAWRIRYITISAVDDDIVEVWADGNDLFNKKWTDRLLYTYS